MILKVALEALFTGAYKVESRTMLRLNSSTKLFDPLNFALNDFTIMKKDTSSMITVQVFVDGELLNSFWSDGIIVSTPNRFNRLLIELWRATGLPKI
jgi:NAD+ kinase